MSNPYLHLPQALLQQEPHEDTTRAEESGTCAVSHPRLGSSEAREDLLGSRCKNDRPIDSRWLRNGRRESTVAGRIVAHKDDQKSAESGCSHEGVDSPRQAHQDQRAAENETQQDRDSQPSEWAVGKEQHGH